MPPPPGVCTLTTSPGTSWKVIFDGSSRAAFVSGFRMYLAGRAEPPPKSPHGAYLALSERIEKLGSWPGNV